MNKRRFYSPSSLKGIPVEDAPASKAFAVVIVGELPPDVLPEHAQQVIIPLFMSSLAITPAMRSSALFLADGKPLELMAQIQRAIAAPKLTVT